MDRTEKQAEIGAIKERFDKMVSAVFVDYKGLNVEQVTELRDKFREAGVEYRVVKNSLVANAIKDEAWGSKLDGTLKGMTGIAWSYEDPGSAAKVLKAFLKEQANQKLQIKAGLVDGEIMDGKAVESHLATLPGKDELRATLLATLQAPLVQFVQQLNAPAQNFAYLLSAKQADGEGAA